MLRRKDNGRKDVRFHGSWRDASTRDEAQIAAWGRDPAVSFVVDCERSGIVGVDLDVKPDANGLAWWGSQGLSRSRMVVRTPSGGEHHYWRADVDRGAPSTAGDIAPGVDTRERDNGLLFAPGSLIAGDPEGRRYALTGALYDVDELDVVPPEVCDLRDRALAGRQKRRDRAATAPREQHDRAWVLAECERQRDRVRLWQEGAGDFRLLLGGAAVPHGRAVAAGLMTRGEAGGLLASAAAAVWGSANADDERWIDEGISKGEADPWRVVEHPPGVIDRAALGLPPAAVSRAAVPLVDEAPSVSAVVAPGRRLKVTRASAVVPRRIRWLWDRRVVAGGLTLLAGREGLGKSTIAVELTAQITRGTLDGEHHGTPRSVVYVNSEDARDYTIVPRLIAAGADLDRVVFIDAVTGTDDGEFESPIVLPLDTDLLAEVVREQDGAMVVLDAATSVIDGKLDGDKDRQMRQGLERIAKVGEETGAGVLGLVHFGKRDSGDTGKLILGSIAWSQVARSVLAVARDDETGQVVLSTTKANLGPGAPSLAAQIVSVDVPTDDGTASVGRVQWLGETDQDARELLAERDPDERADRSAAAAWLQDYLTEFDRAKSADVKTAARGADISPRTLARARKELGVVVTSEGFPRVSYWTMPDGDEPSGASERPRAREAGTTGTTEPDQGEQAGTTAQSCQSCQPPCTRHDCGTTGTTDALPMRWRGSGEPA